jgi:hypothetical protein
MAHFSDVLSEQEIKERKSLEIAHRLGGIPVECKSVEDHMETVKMGRSIKWHPRGTDFFGKPFREYCLYRMVKYDPI